MTNLNKPLPARFAAFSIDREVRTKGRLAFIEQFRERASIRGAEYISSEMQTEPLFIHELDVQSLKEIVSVAESHLDEGAFIRWMRGRAIDALREKSFDKAAVILELARGEVKFSVDNFPVFTPELLQFLENHSKHFTLNPFTQMEWRNGAGFEGFKTLLMIVGAPTMKEHIRDDPYESDEDTYTSLGALCEEGLLDDFLDRETINLVFARRIIQTLSRAPHKTVIADMIGRYSSARLLEIFATEAKLGNSRYQAEALTTLLPYLPQA
ncbi:hypothetical protein [Pseudomonas amygdali]|uniref:Uncharacterized protein n=1 Tax=Pseudomonas amygdali pv. lachrymans str. M301315 TaxID=629260 RepID=A0AAD0V978_PSEAV|nr:hypothetical protein [Pseudomonas amygdali]AXH59708.1 hypothetical protein PLA107_031290 [Pseudomonas amygdali pv. lachrymans str. M301315]